MNYTLNSYTGGIIQVNHIYILLNDAHLQKVKDTFQEGKHGVRITGWGIENGTRFWVAANSYGQEFGENGWIRIEKGQNLMGIEQSVFAPMPDLNKLPDHIKNNG